MPDPAEAAEAAATLNAWGRDLAIVYLLADLYARSCGPAAVEALSRRMLADLAEHESANDVTAVALTVVANVRNMAERAR